MSKRGLSMHYTWPIPVTLLRVYRLRLDPSLLDHTSLRIPAIESFHVIQSQTNAGTVAANCKNDIFLDQVFSGLTPRSDL